MTGPAHRSVSNIRPSAANGPSYNTGVPASPQTPVRAISSNFASPSTLRAEEDYVIIELGSRYMRAGFAGDALPKAVVGIGPEQQRRAGDYRSWQTGYDADWRERQRGDEWGESHELWKLDLRSMDLALVADKIGRLVREAFTKYLLIDSRPRRVALVLPSALPLPLLSTILDVMFNNFQPPTISLMSAPVLTTVAAGLRASLVVDIGWAETVVTGIFEYREVRSLRTIRASKLLSHEMVKLLGKGVLSATQEHQEKAPPMRGNDFTKVVSFEECEDIIDRLAWCMPAKTGADTVKVSEALTHDSDQDENQASSRILDPSSEEAVSIPLKSTGTSIVFEVPFSSLAKPCENAFFADGIKTVELDDEELPLPLLVYRTLLQLPVDVRSVCMSRIIFTGGGSNIPGLKNRIIDDVRNLIRERGWDPVEGLAFNQLRLSRKLRANSSKKANYGPAEIAQTKPNLFGSMRQAAFEDQEPDPIEDKIRRDANKGTHPYVQGTLRTVESLGPWSGASILCQLKVAAVSIIDREQWLQQGAAGAFRAAEIHNFNQRQSIGPGGTRTAPGDRSSWTLGLWG